MNNILTFEDYRKMNIRQVESVIYRQFIEEDIKDEVNEGFIRDRINRSAAKFVQNALAEEIEKGKELEKSIKEALDGLNKGFNALEERIDADTERGNQANEKLNAIEKVKEAIKAVQSQAFDTLAMIGSEGEIDFAGFLGSATVSAAVNFGILFSPIRSVFITRKAYKYFIGIIKQTIRRNLLVIQLNFDQFENLILQKSFESEEDSEFMTKLETMNNVLTTMTSELCGEKTKFLKNNKNTELKTKIEIMRKKMKDEYEIHNASSKSNPLRSLWEDQHNNTYTRTLEQIKQYINDDSQKELDALKNSVTKMAGNDAELAQYGELLLSAAEEYAIKTNHGINNNFIKMSSVFNLENQKKLIELIKHAQEENEKEVQRRKDNQDKKALEEKNKKDIETGKNLYEEKLKSGEKYTFDSFNDTFSDDDQKCLKAFFQSDEGQEAYKELIKKHPLYKYLLFGDIELTNTFYDTIHDLKLVKVSHMDDEFFNSIVKKENALYYMMAERSIKHAIKPDGKTSDYFGFDITEDDVDGNVLDNTMLEKDSDGNSKVNTLFETMIKTEEEIKGKHKIEVPKPKYFLTSTGDYNLFNLLHNDFKTKIFKSDGEYISDISTKNKEVIIKLINKELKIGSNVSSLLAEYLVRLEAHMLIEQPKDSWEVIKNNEEIKSLFKPNSKKLLNKNAFVEVRQDDFEAINKFLSEYEQLRKNDFAVESEPKEENENK